MLGLLVCYLTRPPEPGTDRAEIAAAYGMSIGELRAGHRELAERGHLLQLRRCVGRGQWQHLIVVVDTPGSCPARARPGCCWTPLWPPSRRWPRPRPATLPLTAHMLRPATTPASRRPQHVIRIRT
ncbi:hypothetical protein ACFQ0B_09930 [Nonomuraea thailandensis]